MPRLMRSLTPLMLCVALAACGSNPAPTGTRNPSAPMSSIASFDTQRFAGRWYEVQTYLPDGASCVLGAVTFSPQSDGNMTITEGPCADGDPQSGVARRVGPGRFDFAGETLWVLWVDDTYDTAVIATPEGRAHILSRSLTPKTDRVVAARDILEWNGFDVSRLSAARRL